MANRWPWVLHPFIAVGVLLSVGQVEGHGNVCLGVLGARGRLWGLTMVPSASVGAYKYLRHMVRGEAGCMSRLTESQAAVSKLN